MPIAHRTSIAILPCDALTAASCGGDLPAAPSATPSIARSPAPPPARSVDAAVNSNGLRESRELDHAKPEGRMRILSVGGSITFGDGVSRDPTCQAWRQKNMRGRGYEVAVLNAGRPGRTLAESAALLQAEILKYEPCLVVVSTKAGEGAAARAELERIEAAIHANGIVSIPLAAVDYVAAPTYTPKPPAVSLVPSGALLDAFADKAALLDGKGSWIEFAHKTMGNTLAELIVGAPLIRCATGPVTEIL